MNQTSLECSLIQNFLGILKLCGKLNALDPILKGNCSYSYVNMTPYVLPVTTFHGLLCNSRVVLLHFRSVTTLYYSLTSTTGSLLTIYDIIVPTAEVVTAAFSAVTSITVITDVTTVMSLQSLTFYGVVQGQQQFEELEMELSSAWSTSCE